ncbi:MAG: hypothetical protein F6K58_03355 [Symploca sp. SIO2E9]|nr:hypothetical protein [Symploca sp. SIO2E9]
MVLGSYLLARAGLVVLIPGIVRGSSTYILPYGDGERGGWGDGEMGRGGDGEI